MALTFHAWYMWPFSWCWMSWAVAGGAANFIGTQFGGECLVAGNILERGCTSMAGRTVHIGITSGIGDWLIPSLSYKKQPMPETITFSLNVP
ncbi:hypothetical protein BH23BAC3_BH23BAC3_31060 [soil metagenome]